jgi:hypothetical protein
MYMFTETVAAPTSGYYKVYAGDGNNGQLIVRLLKNRGFWTQTDDINEANIIWTQHPRSEQMKKLTAHEQLQLQLCQNEESNSTQSEKKERK